MQRTMFWAALWACSVLALGGCAAQEGVTGATQTPASTQTPEESAQPTMQVITPSPAPTSTPVPTREPMPVTVEGEVLSKGAHIAQGKSMLPLLETMQRLGYKATVSELGENEGTRRVHTFKKEKEEVAVSYLLRDNTVSDVSFARDKMIVPVDRLLTFEEETIFAPANFFEEALGVYITAEDGQITVSYTQPEPSGGEDAGEEKEQPAS